MNLCEAVREMILAAGITAVYIINVPASVTGDAVVITPYSGETIRGTEAGWQSIQFRVAAKTFPASENLAWKVFRAVVGKRIVGADRGAIGVIMDIQEPFYLDQDEGGRYVHVFNVMAPAIWKGE